MKKILIIFSVMFLFGCTNLTVKQKFPSVVETLMEPPPQLQETPKGASATEVFDVVIMNYGMYYEIANKLKGWQDWYELQKEIYNSNK